MTRARAAWLVLAGLAALPAGAQEPALVPTEVERYAVEVLVFRHENAPDDIADPATEPGAVPLAGPDTESDAGPVFGDRDTGETGADADPVELAPALSYEPLPDEERALADIETRLRETTAYEPLLYAGWVQESFAAAEAPAYSIGQADAPDLIGTVRFSRGRYPHLELDLTWRPPALAGAHPDWRGYRLEEYRRMRDQEVHYFDNAHFGVIARVAPYPPEAPDDAAANPPPAAALNEPR